MWSSSTMCLWCLLFVMGQTGTGMGWESVASINAKNRLIAAMEDRKILPLMFELNSVIPGPFVPNPLCTPKQHKFEHAHCSFLLAYHGKYHLVCCNNINACSPEAHYNAQPCDCGYGVCQFTPPTANSTSPTSTTTTSTTSAPGTETAGPATTQPTPFKVTRNVVPEDIGNDTNLSQVTRQPNKEPPAQTSLKCYSCESTQGDSSLACKDNPTSTKVIICKKGQVCRTVTYISEARGGSVIIRGCADPNDKTILRMRPRNQTTVAAITKKPGPKNKKPPPKKGVKKLTTRLPKKGKTSKKPAPAKRTIKGCVANPPYLPSVCDPGVKDCGHDSCGCTCTQSFCNGLIFPGQGWNACKKM